MTKNLKGFTILEALISLILIGIIIALSYSLINLIGKQISLFEKENIQVLEYNLFNTTLKYDIEKSNDYKVEGKQLILNYYNDDIITYNLKGNSILREHLASIDTFNINIKNYKFATDSEDINTTLSLTLELLNDTINANYFLDKNMSEVINNTYLNED